MRGASPTDVELIMSVLDGECGFLDGGSRVLDGGYGVMTRFY